MQELQTTRYSQPFGTFSKADKAKLATGLWLVRSSGDENLLSLQTSTLRSVAFVGRTLICTHFHNGGKESLFAEGPIAVLL